MAAIKLADEARRLEHPVVLKDDAKCHRLNFATIGGGTPLRHSEALIEPALAVQ